MLRDITSPHDCRHLVDGFYSKVRDDALLGPVFAKRIDDWSEHLDTMARFWSQIVFGMPVYHGSPPIAHRGLGIAPEHFSRWLALWHQTVRELFAGPTADDVVARADRIAIVLARRIAEVEAEVAS